jgi:EF hand domain-containing protein
MNNNRSSALAGWSALTILLSAFLLFQVQPVITKKILPWFGGSPAVWTTCVLFFQLVLLGGYAYAHVITHQVQARWQALVHLAIVLGAVGLLLLFFPPSAIWKPVDGSWPALRILTLLAAVIAVPYFVLSTTGPLVQAWFARLYPGRSPYRLYSLSNIGSLAALLTYPFLIEPALRVDTQGHVWSLGFIGFGVLITILALGIWKFDKVEAGLAKDAPITAAEGLVAKRNAALPDGPATNTAPPPDAPPPVGLRMSWLLLAALASMAFLAITNHLCQDIAVVPFMWVVPLSLYLLSFIICFDNEWWYWRKTYGLLAILMILWLTAIKEYTAVNNALDYPQQVFAAFFQPPKFDDPDDAIAYRKKPLREKVSLAQPYYSRAFSRANDYVFDKFGAVVGKVNQGLNWLTKDRTPVKLDSGETFASLDKNKDGKLTKEELPEPALAPLVAWDANSDGEITEEEFNQRAGKRENKFSLVFNVETYDFKEHVFVASAAYMLALFFICMVCHGELVKSKPQPKYLTSFYLSISAGGALGGLFVALVCPMIFKTHFEMAIAMVGGFIVGWLAIFHDGRDRWLKGREVLQWALAFVMVGTALFAVRLNMDDIESNRLAKMLPEKWQEKLTAWNILHKPDRDLIAMERNFYGTVTVSKMGDDDDPYNVGRALYNGRIWHGFQFTDPSRELEPSTYYVSGTGAALAVQENPRAGQGLRVAVIGLGSGSMAAHAQKGDTFRFYDIDPKVEMVAHKYFTYLDKIPKARDCTVDVVMGDARISLERELKSDGPLNYDVLHLDAFSGDAIPAHLLTDESFDLYDQHLRQENGKSVGIVVVHISNRYLDLEPVVYAIAKKHGYDTLVVHKTEDGGPTDTASDWILVTKNTDFLNKLRNKGVGEPLAPDKKKYGEDGILWTDQFTALYPIMK